MLGMSQRRQLAGLYLRGGLFFSSSGLEYDRQRLDGSQAVLVVVEFAPTRCTVRAENRPSIGMFAFFYFCHQINLVGWSQVGGNSFYQISDFNLVHQDDPKASAIHGRVIPKRKIHKIPSNTVWASITTSFYFCASRGEQLCRCPCRFHGWTCSCAFLLPGGSRQRVQSGFVRHVSSYLYYA